MIFTSRTRKNSPTSVFHFKISPGLYPGPSLNGDRENGRGRKGRAGQVLEERKRERGGEREREEKCLVLETLSLTRIILQIKPCCQFVILYWFSCRKDIWGHTIWSRGIGGMSLLPSSRPTSGAGCPSLRYWRQGFRIEKTSPLPIRRNEQSCMNSTWLKI